MLLVQMSIFSISATADNYSSSRERTPYSFLLDPATGEYLPVRNMENEFAEITANQPRDLMREQAFEEHREQMLADQNSSFVDSDTTLTPPVPGGVGYGYFYNSTFRTGFAKGTAISYDIICPTTAGGNNSNYLYLTATNRASKGVEAYISYWSQNNLEFIVFDWARPEGERWQVSIPHSNLSSYLRTKTIHGVSYQYLTVQHRTEIISGNTWRNVVWLQNSGGTYDQVYYYSYTSTLADQQSSNTWAPIVETFQDSYSNTNTFGFNNTFLAGADSGGTWSSWALLSTTQSYAQNDNKGFTTVFTDPNYGFAVH